MAAATSQDHAAPRLGVLAFGDSITNGGGELQMGVALQSWALWTARGLGLPYTGYAVDGALVGDVVDAQIPAFLTRAVAGYDGSFDVGCLYVGVNDVRRPEWSAATFALGHDVALAFLAQRCERVLALTAPLRLGRPPAGDKVLECNAIVRRGAAAHGALVVELTSFGARNQLMVDHVHPTAFGQIAIAQRALAVLAGDGLAARVDPASLISWETTWSARLRSDATYVYRDLKQRARVVMTR